MENNEKTDKFSSSIAMRFNEPRYTYLRNTDIEIDIADI